MSTAKVPMSNEESFGSQSRCPHAAQFYDRDDALLDSLTRFVGNALVAGDAAIVVASQSHREALGRRLVEYGLDPARIASQGRYVSLDAADTLSKFMAEGWPDAARFESLLGDTVTRAAASSESGCVAVFGEMVAILWAEGKAGACIRLEEMWNDLSRTLSFSLLCAYPIAAFNRTEHEERFLKICAEHTNLIPAEDYTTLKDENRHLNVASLQQKAQALKTEKWERQEVEKTLEIRESELADFLENALEGIQRTGPDQEILWANRALLRLLGYSADQYFGHPLSGFFADQQAFDEFWAKLMRREEIYDYPADLKCRDGSIKRVLIHSNGLWEGDKFLHTRTFIRDVTERAEMEKALLLAHDNLEARVKERTEELGKKNAQMLRQSEVLDATNRGLRQLSARLMQVQDDERRRIARDLHDSTGQALALLSMNLSVLETEAGQYSPELAKGLSDNAVIVRQISEELRTLSYLLHPPLLEEMGLESALQWYIDGFAQRSGIKVHFDELHLGRLSRDMEIAIFRAVQECLTNVHRHSGSLTATIRLHASSDGVILDVKDEGKGIPTEMLAKIASAGASGVGLRGLRERIKDFGGEVEIASDGRGTRIRILLPMSA